ncbi:uncharacterized protein GLRG_06125 [Colletotrichum graminicola M1.001]|uniref:Uncharacterized protein n=1 Tax=Colletotrichum graminicola (strain M1.001 / M2 / FGSC 10212) TaxID=645133 RepID=E3QJE3_COLGM|nr:uncharacterized protein GLRG_06125 [Colletotrichum graminicola M1.001]EFQ30981.1 hypothetical protein GLRG_06125 [Colletotrichum graminicola M1.001]
MESSHHRFGMFPPALPTIPASYPQPVTPAKREDDDVQFVSSNPVKKRRIDCHQDTPQLIGSSPHMRPPALCSHEPPKPAKPTAQPERRGSTGMVAPTPATHMPDTDPMRGCSVPTPERSGYQETFWTAPRTGPQSSPPVSPKTLPENISLPMLRTDNAHESANGHLETMRISHQQREIKDMVPAHTAPSPAGVTDAGKATTVINAVPATDAMIASQQTTTLEPTPGHFRTDNEPKHAASASPRHHTNAVCSKTTITQSQPHTHHCTSSSSPVVLATQVGPYYGASETQAGSCRGRPASGAKGPCRQCIEAKMRQQAANMAAATTLPSAQKAQSPNQTSVPSSAIQQPWAHLLGVNPYHTAMAGAMYGPLLQQPLMPGATGPFAVTPQQSHMPPGIPTHQVGGNMYHFGSVSPMPQTQAYTTQQPPAKPIKVATGNVKPQTARILDTQPTTKHIIVDVAETCFNVFPFAEVAKRHNQPEQKVRDIFAAVIQLPLLRCPTDKRRAGKLGTARVKEFNQAKKEVQVQQADTGQLRQESQNQAAYMPSAWDVAQFMGPSDMQPGGLPQYSGLW